MVNFLLVHHSNVTGTKQSEALVNIDHIVLIRNCQDLKDRAVISSLGGVDLTVDESYEEVRDALDYIRARELPRSGPRPTPPPNEIVKMP